MGAFDLWERANAGRMSDIDAGRVQASKELDSAVCRHDPFQICECRRSANTHAASNHGAITIAITDEIFRHPSVYPLDPPLLRIWYTARSISTIELCIELICKRATTHVKHVYVIPLYTKKRTRST